MQTQPVNNTRSRTEVAVNSFVQGVYTWMGIGLTITGVTAYVVAHNQTLLEIIYPIRLFLALGTLALVFFLSARIGRMSASTATGVFIVYSALMGAVLSSIFIVYDRQAISSTFLVTAGTFLAVSVYGWTTKRDLTSVGSFMFMGLIGIIIASIVNLFLHSTALQMIIAYLGVFIFIGLTAYDTQQLKEMALTQPDDVDAGVIRKGTIIGALRLYLDFINLFLFFLQIMGGGRE